MSFKTFLITAVLLTVVSCRKEYTCSCTADDSIHNIEHSTTLAKNAAEEWCTDWNNDIYYSGEQEKEGWQCVLLSDN